MEAIILHKGSQRSELRTSLCTKRFTVYIKCILHELIAGKVFNWTLGESLEVLACRHLIFSEFCKVDDINKIDSWEEHQENI